MALDKAKGKVNQLQKSLDAMLNGETTPQSIKNLQRELDKADKGYAALRDRARQLESEKSEIEYRMTMPTTDPKDADRLKYIETQLEEIGAESEALYSKGEKINATLEEMKLNPYLIPEVQKLHTELGYAATNVEIAEDKVGLLEDKLEATGREGKKAFKNTSNGAKKTAKHTKRANGEMSRLWNRLKGLAASALIFNSISKGLTSMKEKLGKMLRVNAEYNNSLSEIYGNLLTAFQPIYEYILPALNAFLAKMKVLTSYLATFTSTIFGKTVEESEAAAEALQKQADAANNLNEALGSYDELSVIGQDNKSSDTITPTFNVTDYSGDSYMQTIREAVESGDVAGVVEALTGKLNEAIKGVDFRALGESLGTGFDTLIDSMYAFFTTMDWNELGEAIGSFIDGGLQSIDFRKLGNTIQESVNSVTEMITGFFRKVDFGALGRDIADLLYGLIESIDAKTLADNITTVITSILLLVSGFLERLDVSDMSEMVTELIYTLINEINWIQLIGTLSVLLITMIVSAIEGVCSSSFEVPMQWLSKIFEGLGWDGAAAFLDGIREKISGAYDDVKKWIEDHVIKPVKEALGINSPSTVFRNIGQWCIQGFTNGLRSLKQGAVSIFTGIWTKITGVFSFSKVRSFFEKVSSSIQSAFNGIPEWFRSKFYEAWTKVKSVFSAGKDGTLFVDIKDGVLSGLKSVINGLIDGINKVISEPFKGLNTALNTIKKVNILGNKPFKNIATISVPQIPKLAKGDVIPPNKEFLAVLGDQKHGTNIETPLDTMVEAFNKALDERGDESGDIIVKIDERELGRASRKRNKKHQKRYGTPEYA